VYQPIQWEMGMQELGRQKLGMRELYWQGTATGDTAGVEVVAGVAAGVVAGVAGMPVPARSGEEVTAGEIAAGVAATVAAAVTVGVSVGVGGRGTNGVGTSLAWLAGEGDGEEDGEADGVTPAVAAGVAAAVTAGVLNGQRPQVMAQKPKIPSCKQVQALQMQSGLHDKAFIFRSCNQTNVRLTPLPMVVVGPKTLNSDE